jgi:hypothetical protein
VRPQVRNESNENVADRCIVDGLYVTDFLADKSAGGSVPVKIEKLRIDRTQLTYIENN